MIRDFHPDPDPQHWYTWGKIAWANLRVNLLHDLAEVSGGERLDVVGSAVAEIFLVHLMLGQGNLSQGPGSPIFSSFSTVFFLRWTHFTHVGRLQSSVADPVTFWYGSGSVDPYLWLPDLYSDSDPAPDPATFVTDLQDGKKKFCLLLFNATFRSFFKNKTSYRSHKTVGSDVFLFLTIFARL